MVVNPTCTKNFLYKKKSPPLCGGDFLLLYPGLANPGTALVVRSEPGATGEVMINISGCWYDGKGLKGRLPAVKRLGRPPQAVFTLAFTMKGAIFMRVEFGRCVLRAPF